MFILTAKFLFVFQTLGSIPWQSYFQRVLSVRSVGDARRLSFLAGLSSLVCAVPPICLGVIGATVGNMHDNLLIILVKAKHEKMTAPVEQFHSGTMVQKIHHDYMQNSCLLFCVKFPIPNHVAHLWYQNSHYELVCFKK